MIQFTYHPPLWTIIVSAVVLLTLLGFSYRAAKGRPNGVLQVLFLVLRAVAIAAVILCLLDPQWVETIKHQQKSRVAVLLDNSQSMSIRDLGPSRSDAAKDWVKTKMLPALPQGVSLSTYTFDAALAPVPTIDSASPTGSVTALSEALERVLSLPGDDPLLGVFVVSDGIDNVDRAPERIARLYRQKGVPVHTMTVGTTNDMRDVILENVQVKRAVPNESPTRVALTIRSPGFAERTVSVQVRSAKNILAVREVTLNGASQKVELDITPRAKGFQIYEVAIDPLDGEWLTSNNRRKFGLEVVDPTIHVLYMEGTPQQPTSPMPEWKYLKDALESDPNIKVRTLYRQFGSNGKYLNTIDVDPVSGEKIYPVEHPTQGFPKTLAELLEYDVVIHSDIKKESFSPQQLENIARLVEQHGGGFVMIGGNSAFGKGGYHRTVLDRIIPVAMEQENDSQNLAFHLQIPRSAWTHPILNIGATPEESQMIWTRKFPMLYGFNRVDRPKPGAVVLGLNSAYQNENGPGVLLAVQEIGKGRSMAFASDTTRTWGRDFETIWGEPIRANAGINEQNCDSRYYRQFWVNAVRWLANGRKGQTNSAVTLELAQSRALPDEAIPASVKVRDEQGREIPNARVSLTLTSNGKTNAIARAEFEQTTRSYIANLRAPSAGTFVVTAVAETATTRLGDDRQLLVSEATDLEMNDVRARPEFMAKLSKDSGGESYNLSKDSTSSPAYAFSKAPAPTVEYRRTAAWDKSLVLAAILGLLAAEWAVRRAKGLA